MDPIDDFKNFIKAGNAEIPIALLRDYHRIGLNNQELLLLVQLYSFAAEGQPLPSSAMISGRTNFSEKDVQRIIDGLLKKKVLALNKHNDGYDLSSIAVYLLQKNPASGDIALANKNNGSDESLSGKKSRKYLYRLFQQEFGRMLTPLELQTINEWIVKDDFNIELISVALQQAVNSQILNLRYIEHILLNWKKSNIRTKDQAQAENLKHRQEMLNSNNDYQFDQDSGKISDNQSKKKKITPFKIPMHKIGQDHDKKSH
ncbi:DnaD domain protein [Oenococcus alcoholitolerans]|uniref:DnaD domain protein n=1 Tax=Oenococcus alcoholitolerans TaxID=931074 RepID=UPI003F72A3C5